jgi:repressor LexA
MSLEITIKQKEILNFIESEVSKRGYPPSVREICEAVDLKSPSTVHGHLQRLEKKGYIRRDSTKPRAIEVLNDDKDMMNNVIDFPKRQVADIPLIGKVTAGQPILAIEDYEDTFPVPLEFIENGQYFMLRVDGDSMIEAGILDRDYVLVKQQSAAKNGDMVVALIDDSATVKTFYKEANRICLQPENSSMSPIYSDSVNILGLVKGVFRKL